MGLGRVRFNDDSLELPKITKKMLMRIFRYFIPYWKLMLVVILTLSVSSVVNLVPPLAIRSILDHALPQHDMQYLTILLGISIAAAVTSGLLLVGQNYLKTLVARNIIYDMKNQMYRHVQHMSLRFFSSVRSGEIITRMNSDINGVQDMLNQTIINTLSSTLTMVATAAALFAMNWKLAILGMVIVPLFIFPTRKVGKVRWKIVSQTQEKVDQLNQHLQETFNISGSILTKIFNKEKSDYEKFERINLQDSQLRMKESLAGQWFTMTVTIFSFIGPMLIYFFGGYLFVKGEISIGEIVAFAALLAKMYTPVAQLSNIHINVVRSFALFQRIFDYFDQPHDIEDRPLAKTITATAGRIDFEHVAFSYDHMVDVLQDISFTVEPDTMTALVGVSGAGKTTITNLIPRLYDVTEGVVKIDGEDIRNITLTSLRSQIGIVMQESYLFNDTIEANLKYAKEDATQAEIIAACQAAYIHDFIMTLSDQYQTLVGNRGIKLSGGEKQRISIARVILKDPKIVIFDEATSSLDSVSEMYIQKAMIPLLKGKTSIVIAHRLSTILAADQILVVEKGKIVESGKHAELLALDGIYRKLCDTQFKTEEHV
ncbi:ABC transporter ATP-binding protein/permease [Dehalobacter sp. DCM]|uniref:ABC transporter ATP-binding protein n=1 Tax=Dehalobacter sp. DCM TaxID=2907827 RepID=UPI003081DE8D|nr:ABC transporter ATP-binding protein/permease [Dehalobacter sp. DCM]